MNNCSVIFVALGITITVIGIIVIIISPWRNGEYEGYEGKNQQKQINIYITSLNDPLSKKRARAQKLILKKFGITKYKYNSALHWKKDHDHIRSAYPKINMNSVHFVKRPGAYGLAASFLQFLNTAYVHKHKLASWMEDDVIPAGGETGLPIKTETGLWETVDMINKSYEINNQLITNFQNKFWAAINNLPEKKNDVYFFGHTTYCDQAIHTKADKPDDDWFKIRRNAFYKAGGPGTSFIIFSKNAIISIFEWVQKNRIDLPIDLLFMKFINDKVITGWEVNTSITHNQMFYGLFEQLGTYCDRRENNTINT